MSARFERMLEEATDRSILEDDQVRFATGLAYGLLFSVPLWFLIIGAVCL
jgi:hypothetical protein